jgi:acyl-CoA reductase-like NAD-dependent aldehyde dehydrogenase
MGTLTATRKFVMTIGGEWVRGSDSFGVINPATEKVFEHAPECTREELDAAMDAACRAFPAWSQDEDRRRQSLLDCAEAIGRHAEELAPLLTREQGKPLAAARKELAEYAAGWFQFTSTLQLPVEVVQDDANAHVEVRRRPCGVVAAITPWNYPVLLASWKIAPALLAGDTVLLKPSPFTPLTTLRLGEILAEVLPAGVLNVVSGSDELGAMITTHPTPRKISFTGSVDTGKKVAAAAATDLKRLTLELGGNDAAIVLEDADVGKIAMKLFWSAFNNCGQVCCAIKRLYVHERIAEELVEALADIARSIKVGDGMEPDTQLGPINNRPQYERVIGLVEDAKNAGATIVTGGSPIPGDGYFYPPTLVTGVGAGTRLVDEEQFGPVLPIMRYQDVEEAVRLANATTYGLGGSVWSSDPERAAGIARRLDAGTVWINSHMVPSLVAPFGGVKWSGLGVENGTWGLHGFTELQTVNVALV